MNDKLIKSKSTAFYEIRDYIMICLGTLIYTGGVSIFMLPYGLTIGGVSGISSIIYYATNIPVSISYGVINACFLIVAIKVLGWKFCFKTIAGVVSSTLWFSAWQLMLQNSAGEWPHVCGDQIFMACILGPIFCGIGLSINFENHGSMGGTDIIAAIVNKYKDVSLGQIILLCDVLIISSCYFVFEDIQRVIYGYVIMIVCSVTLDTCMRRMHQAVRFEIYSRNYAKIADEINEEGFGITVLDGFGWYTKSERKMLVCICSRRYQDIIMQAIKRIDPYAFFCVSNVNNVYGTGFSAIKSKLKNQKPILTFATNDERLINEAKNLMGENIEVRSLSDIGCKEQLPQTHETIEKNAQEKVRYVHKYYGFDCFAQCTEGDREAYSLIYHHNTYKFDNLQGVSDFIRQQFPEKGKKKEKNK